MAARLNRRHSELVLARIRTSQLINRLQDNALGKLGPLGLSESQVRSATFLIERTIARAVAPQDVNLQGDLKLTVVTGVPDKPIA